MLSDPSLCVLTLILSLFCGTNSVKWFPILCLKWGSSVYSVIELCCYDPYGRSLAGIAGSNPARDMDVCRECCVLSGRGLCNGPITRKGESNRLWCVWVWSRSLDNGEALTHWGPLRHAKQRLCGYSTKWLICLILCLAVAKCNDPLLSGICGCPVFISAPLYRHWGSVQAVRPVGRVEV